MEVPDPAERDDWGSNRSQCMQLQIVAVTYRIQTKSWVNSDSAFYQITCGSTCCTTGRLLYSLLW